MNYVSKSDFKVARSCATKLYYKKSRYPTTLDDDAYMELLADGGFMVGKFAQLLFPGGVLIIEMEPLKAVADTARLMSRPSVTLFEPAFLSDGYLARIDILRKEGDCIELIEVKSKGFDATEGLTGKNGAIRSEWVEYVEDIAFQRMVLERLYPKATITSRLLVPDKNTKSGIDLLPTWFSIRRRGRGVEVDFSGDLVALRKSALLRTVPVDAEIAIIRREVSRVAAELAKLVLTGLRKAAPKLGYECRGCEYRVADDVQPSGFRECWDARANVTPSILDLYQLGRVKNANKGLLADDLIAAGKVSLFDVPTTSLTTAYADRQRIQIAHTKSNKEWRSPQLKPLLEDLEYPLHFIDFETSRLVLPYHRGMRPFEQVAFQWSCHSIDRPGAELRHAEWINLEEGFPNAKFASALRAAIGEKGTLLTWSHHEKTTLDDIARQIADYELPEDDLRVWLKATTKSGRIFDLCAHANGHYFHPAMKGSTSIKAVLPAIWRSNPRVHAHPWFSAYAKVEKGEVVDPYKTLAPLPIYERSEVVTEGTGAMRAYQEMLYGEGRHDASVKEAWRDLLLQYCKLDTLAMVIIWRHWIE